MKNIVKQCFKNYFFFFKYAETKEGNVFLGQKEELFFLILEIDKNKKLEIKTFPNGSRKKSSSLNGPAIKLEGGGGLGLGTLERCKKKVTKKSYFFLNSQALTPPPLKGLAIQRRPFLAASLMQEEAIILNILGRTLFLIGAVEHSKIVFRQWK